jgi:hypothetical protein
MPLGSPDFRRALSSSKEIRACQQQSKIGRIGCKIRGACQPGLDQGKCLPRAVTNSLAVQVALVQRVWWDRLPVRRHTVIVRASARRGSWRGERGAHCIETLGRSSHNAAGVANCPYVKAAVCDAEVEMVLSARAGQCACLLAGCGGLEWIVHGGMVVNVVGEWVCGGGINKPSRHGRLLCCVLGRLRHRFSRPGRRAQDVSETNPALQEANGEPAGCSCSCILHSDCLCEACLLQSRHRPQSILSIARKDWARSK